MSDETVPPDRPMESWPESALKHDHSGVWVRVEVVQDRIDALTTENYRLRGSPPPPAE